MTIHLTDDEIVATCGLLGLGWPFPLPTVDSDPIEITRASRRGVRSLTVRALLGVDAATDEPGLAPDVTAAVTNVVNGVPLLVSGVIDENGALLASGSGAFVVQAPDGSGVLATTTASGIHAISTSTLDEAREAFVALADNALTTGLAGNDDARLLVLKAGGGGDALSIAQGSVTIGRVSDDSMFVAPGTPETDWDRARLTAHLAA